MEDKGSINTDLSKELSKDLYLTRCTDVSKSNTDPDWITLGAAFKCREVINANSCWDIDSLLDFQIAESLLKIRDSKL